MKKYNLSEIMGKAWDIRRNAAAEMGCKVSEVHLGECVRMAWEHVKSNPENILNQFAVMNANGGEAVNKLLACMVKKAAKNEIAYSTEDHYDSYNENLAWFLSFHNIESFTNQAWAILAERLASPDYLDKLNAKRAQAGKLNISLASLAYRAAKDAIRQTLRDDIKHGRANVRTVTDKNGEEYSYIDTVATSRKDDTETAAVIGTALNAFINGRDEIDRMIIEGIRDGYTEREIGEIVGMSGPAVHKRIDKIRDGLRRAGLAPAAA